jgi:hypothetical protein
MASPFCILFDFVDIEKHKLVEYLDLVVAPQVEDGLWLLIYSMKDMQKELLLCNEILNTLLMLMVMHTCTANCSWLCHHHCHHHATIKPPSLWTV